MITAKKLKNMSQDIWSMMSNDKRLLWDAPTQSFYFRGHQGKFPSTVFLCSHKTGDTLVFTLDGEKALECEFWDGEEHHMMAFLPNSQTKINFIITH